MAIKYKPLADRVLVRPDEPETKSKGGILLPDMAQRRPKTGEVLAVGPGKILSDGSLAETTLSPGDVVLYGEWAGTAIKDSDGSDLILIAESEILAVVER